MRRRKGTQSNGKAHPGMEILARFIARRHRAEEVALQGEPPKMKSAAGLDEKADEDKAGDDDERNAPRTSQIEPDIETDR